MRKNEGKKDKMMDKRMGIREGSMKDMKMDSRMGAKKSSKRGKK